MPGLLQTEDYARDLFAYLRGPKDPSRIESMIRLRMERQEIFSAENPPHTYFLMDEAVIRRVVGGPHIMRRQLLRLKELGQLPHVSIGVVPFDIGMYRGLRVPYVLFEFENPQDDNTLYLENPEGESVIAEDVTEEGDPGVPTPAIHLELFWELEQTATWEQTAALIDDALQALDGAESSAGHGGEEGTIVLPDLSATGSAPATPRRRNPPARGLDISSSRDHDPPKIYSSG